MEPGSPETTKENKGKIYSFRMLNGRIDGLTEDHHHIRTSDVVRFTAETKNSLYDLVPGPPPTRAFPPEAADEETRDFGWALKELRSGRFVTRAGWNGKGQYLGLQRPDAQSVNTLPYIYIVTARGQRGPWLASQPDMLSTDWQSWLIGLGAK